MNKFRLVFLIGATWLSGCRDKYDFQLKQDDISLLVVEGTLNAGNGSTTITLSKTVKINEPALFKPVLQAKLTVEGKDGSQVTLSETGGGKYFHNQLNLGIGKEYRLRIKTTDNSEYLSDYVVAKQTPAIDTVTWKKENGNLTVFANAHDATNNTRYYKWDYDETWEIRTYFAADYAYNGTTIVFSPGGYRHRCWKYASSSTINIGSTAQLQSDVLSEAPVQTIIAGSEKLGVRYSMLLRQQTLTKEAYEYLKLMKKNTETIGSIFDPQPSELRGNIKCLTRPEEIVIGFLTASTFTSKRVFITAQEASWQFVQSCTYEKVKNHPDSLKSYLPNYLPWGAEEIIPGVPTYYLMSIATCVDCTKRGGDLAMPSYW